MRHIRPVTNDAPTKAAFWNWKGQISGWLAEPSEEEPEIPTNKEVKAGGVV